MTVRNGLPVKEIGSRLLRWGVHPTADSRECVISSHGFHRVVSREFVVPDQTSLVFYTPDGVSLQDPGVEKVARGRIVPVSESGPGSRCFDYNLTKYQGYHDSLAGAVFGKPAQPFAKNASESYAGIAGFINLHNVQVQGGVDVGPLMDVITVRYRPGRTSLTLSEAVSRLTTGPYRYRKIHCAFCRSHIRHAFGGPSHAPKARP